MHRWWHDLNPIWIGIAVGIILATAVELTFWLFNVQESDVWIGGQSLTGSYGSEGSLYMFPAILIMWGFFFGLMGLLWNKAKSWKP